MLVHSQLWGKHRKQNHPERVSVPSHRLLVSHFLHRRLPTAALAGMGSPQNRSAEQVLPLVHSAPGFREILRISVGSFQHMEGAGVLRTYK